MSRTETNKHEANNRKKAHEPTIALVGNPNSGKTTIFNQLTGERGHVGNYSGVTVETAEGIFSEKKRRLKIVDLPGTYSLTAYSAEEIIARNFILDENPDLVVHIVDTSNLERNLYLATQMMELNVPVLIALNMSDIAKRRGYIVDTKILSQRLGLPVVETVATKSDGIEDLKKNILRLTEPGSQPIQPRPIHYGREIERALKTLESLIPGDGELAGKLNTRWIALKLLENDEEITRTISAGAEHSAEIAQAVKTAETKIRANLGDSPEIIIADRRYGFISGACSEAVQSTVEMRHSISDRIDIILTNETVGIPIFLTLMYFTFNIIFTASEPLMNWIEHFFAILNTWSNSVIPSTAPLLRSIISDGIISGVGGILVFMPTILLLFLAIALLEDSGYMARAAFIMDRVMHKIGLHGKSFIPLVIGFGCTVPAIMATRMLETRRGRLTTILILPLISCGARLPIYALFIPAFFPESYRTPLLFAVYLTGIILAVVMAKLLRSTIFRGEAEPFVMELPPYRMPTLKGAFIHTWERGWLFLKKAGTIILGASIVLWAMTSFPKPPESRTIELEAGQKNDAILSYSITGRIGHAIEPVMKHVGFDWKTSAALVGALAGKELFVAQLGILNAIDKANHESETLRETLRRQYTPLQALCIMLFCLISVPCAATVIMTWKESGSWKWAALQVAGLMLLAYGVTFMVYRSGLILGRLI